MQVLTHTILAPIRADELEGKWVGFQGTQPGSPSAPQAGCKENCDEAREAVRHLSGLILDLAHRQAREEPDTMADDMRLVLEAIARNLAGMHGGACVLACELIEA